VGGGGVVLYNRLFRQVDRRWMQGMRLLLLLLLLPVREVRGFGVATGCLLPITGDKTPQKPRMVRSGP